MNQYPSNVQDQDYQIIRNQELKESAAVKKNVFSSRVIFIVFFVVFFLIVSYVVVVDKNNIGSKIRNVMFFNRALNREEILAKARANCFDSQSTNDYRQTISDTDKLRYEIIEKLGDKFEPGMVTINEKVPETKNCVVIWLLDKTGKGFAGYKKTDGKVTVNKATYPKETLEIRNNQI